jgi:predicted GIY-YIG superfamily endonuclease
MREERDTYRYHFKVGKKIKYRGVTSDIERRELEHKQRWPDGKIVRIGQKISRQSALEWKRQGGKSSRRE